MLDLIDINVIDDNNSDYLSALFKQKKDNLFKKNVPYLIQFQGKEIKINLSHEILKRYRTKKTHEKEFRYEVISENSLGSGMSSKVYPIIKTLNGNAKVVSNKKMRVVKAISVSEFSRIKIEDEANISKDICYLKAKKPVHVKKEKNNGFIVMKNIKGVSLQTIIENNLINNQNDLLKITINILLVLQYIHKKNLIHSDVKPENIIVDTDTYQVYIIDFGLSIKNNSDSRRGYTPQYVSPELYKGNATQSSDIFSAGLTIAELWGANPRIPSEKKEKPSNYSTTEEETVLRRKKYLKNLSFFVNSPCTLENLGRNVPTNNQYFPLIYFKRIIDKMLHHRIEERAILPTTIRRLQLIKSLSTIQKISKGNANSYNLIDIESLLNYVDKRKQASLKHITLDFFKGIVGFGAQFKMRAALKLYDAIIEEILNSDNNFKSKIIFSEEEIIALREGTLGSLIGKFKKLPPLFLEKEKNCGINMVNEDIGVNFNRMQP